jgi:hypothetical protein
MKQYSLVRTEKKKKNNLLSTYFIDELQFQSGSLKSLITDHDRLT